MKPIQGIHHITAVASSPQENVDFYEQVLGQRLVKTTVNFDDPGTYHLYYGDLIGTPGTIMTFFPWLHMGRGRRGTGETAGVSYRIPAGSLGFWAERLARFGIDVQSVDEVFDEPSLQFEDPDGISLRLTESTLADEISPWTDGPVPGEHAIRGFHGVTLRLGSVERTAALLTDLLGYRPLGEHAAVYRYAAASDMAAFVDLEHDPKGAPGKFGAGSIHHVAFRTVDDDEQIEYQTHLRAAGQDVTPVRDRQYFHSIYFREPGGVLFEVATDAPGFAIDEPVDALGSSLKLPPWFEARRELIEGRLPPIVRRHQPSSS